MPANRSKNLKKRSPNHSLKKVPSFVGLKPASPHSSRVKSRNRAVGTRAELLLRRALRRIGLGYRLHVASLPGRPDVVFPESRVAVFCDGDFWHGRHWTARRAKLKGGSNSRYWVAKIKYNILRDLRQKNALRKSGWIVVRLWETDVLKDADGCAARIHQVLQAQVRAGRRQGTGAHFGNPMVPK